MFSTTGLVIMFAFLAVFLGIFSVNLLLVDLFQRDRKAQLDRLNQELLDYERSRARKESRRESDGTLNELAHEASHEANAPKHLMDRLDELLVQSGVRMSAGRLMFISGSTGVSISLFCFLLLRDVGSAAVALVVGGGIPFFYLTIARKRRKDALLQQLPDALELISRVLRAGQSVPQGVKAVSEEFKPPINLEFGYCYEQQNLGLSPQAALHNLAARTGLLEIKIFVLALLVHGQAGGNLTEMLDNISNVVRKRIQMRREIKSLTAEGRLQAIVLMALPIVVWLGMFFIVHDYAMELFEHPTMIASALTGMFVAAIWIRKLVNFEI